MVEALDEETEYYDEDEDDEEGEPAGCLCVSCESELRIDEEVFLLRVVRASFDGTKLEYFDLIDDEGHYAYEPAFFNFGCWEEEHEQVQDIQEDVPPVQHDAGVILCDICESDILQGETMGLLEIGEVRVAERSPNNQRTAHFVPIGSAEHLCIACLKHLEDNRTDPIWQNEFEPAPDIEVCSEGILARCWRAGKCDCPKRICGG